MASPPPLIMLHPSPCFSNGIFTFHVYFCLEMFRQWCEDMSHQDLSYQLGSSLPWERLLLTHCSHIWWGEIYQSLFLQIKNWNWLIIAYTAVHHFEHSLCAVLPCGVSCSQPQLALWAPELKRSLPAIPWSSSLLSILCLSVPPSILLW